MNNNCFKLLIAGILSMMLVLSGCSSSTTPATPEGGDGTTVGDVGDGDGTKTGVEDEFGIDTGIAATATTVAGKVTLSSIVTAKARKQAAISNALKRGKPGSKAYRKALAKSTATFGALDSRALPSRSADAGFSNGIVELYNSSRPGWIYPVAQTTTDSAGSYTLETLINAERNGNAYTDGEKIPGGNYTLLAYTIHPKTKRPYLVALQAVVSEFAGTISGIDLVAQTSTAEPAVISMVGVSKNTDGTQTWGGNDLILAPNAAIQVAFSIAMNRAALTELELDFSSANGAEIPAGVWTLSADWLTATYYLNEGESWPKGDTYSLTVYGADTRVEKTVSGFPYTGEDLATFNVFGKSLKLTAIGTFSIPAEAIVDTQSPTAQLSSPTLAQTAGEISITTPIRIASNERMDVNGLRLKSEPSLGAQPGVLFIGQNDDSLYEYEFLLGESLALNTTYTMTVSGGNDLAGNEMNALSASFSTEATSEGVDIIPEVGSLDEKGVEITQAAVDTAIIYAGYQAEVKDVFGKWVRAFSDHNLPQLQGLMSGDFFMEYNASSGFDKTDLNRDGLFDFKEYSERMVAAFQLWKFCEVSITGSNVVEDINIVGGEIADFAFTLEAKSGKNTQECKTAAPNASFFATLQKVNGAWYIVQASDGIDTRGQEIKEAVVLSLIGPENAGDPISFYDEALQEEIGVAFSWEDAVIPGQEVASYAFIIIDSRNPQAGFALILPPTTTSIEIPTILEKISADEDADGDGKPDDDGTSTLGKVISKKFGFEDEFEPKEGVEVYWQVAAMGSNTLKDVQAGRETSLPKDVVAISELWRFKIAGEFKELTIDVEASGSPVVFSEFIGGYDVVDASTATITVITPRADVTEGFVYVDGNTKVEKTITFSDGVATVDLDLNQGVNIVTVWDGVPCWATGPCDGSENGRFVEESFQIVTEGGIAAVISLDEMFSVDANGIETALVDDSGWNWFESTDAVSLKILGSVSSAYLGDNSFDRIGLDVWNEEASAKATRQITLASDGTFTVEVEIFKGENWIGVNGEVCDDTKAARNGPGGCEFFNANLGIKTSVGSTYEAPIKNIQVIDAVDAKVDEDGNLIAVIQQENWSGGGMWDATEVTSNSVTISGVMAFSSDSAGVKEPRYSVGSDGGWNSDRMSADLDGSFSITIDLFAGWNYVEIEDVNNNFYRLDILTEGGKTVVRPEIKTIDGAEFTGGDFVTTQCSAILMGTAMEGEVRITWNANIEGNGEFQNYWEEIRTLADAEGEWTATVPLVGNSDDPDIFVDNFIDVFDKNWNWMGVRVINTGDCDYTPPRMSVTSVIDENGDILSVNNSWEDPQGGGGADYGSATMSAKALFAAFPDGSTVIGVTSPNAGDTDLAVTTIEGVVDLGQFPLSGTGVVRIIVKDPESETGPMALFSSSDSDPMVSMFTSMGALAESFTVDSAGAFTVTVDLANKPAVIEVLAWEDVSDVSSETFGPSAEPVAGFDLAVNGAVLDEVVGSDSASGDCNGDCSPPPGGDGAAPGDADGGFEPGDCNGDCSPPTGDEGADFVPGDTGEGSGPGDCTDCSPSSDFGSGPAPDGADGGMKDVGAIPIGSTVVKISNPMDQEEGVGNTTVEGVIDIGAFPLTDNAVARLMLKDPRAQQGPPMALISSRSDDPVQADIIAFDGVEGGVFEVDATGNFAVDLDLDPNVPVEIIMLVWMDMNMGMEANPDHGYFIQINGAEPPEGGDAAGGFFGGDDNSVKTDFITVEGTSNVAAKEISLELFGCGGVERYTAIAGDTADEEGNYAWTSSEITVYQGRNNIGVSNGPQWFNIGLNASNNVALPTPALDIDVLGATKDTFAREECGSSNWSAGDASVVTITGTTTGGDGQGEYRVDGDFGRFDIVEGTFSFEVTLYKGNNRIDINDAEWNSHSVSIQTNGGDARPQFVELDTYTFAEGKQTVEGTIYSSPGNTEQGFKPDFVGGGMDSCDSDGSCMWVEFSTDPNAADWGASPMILTGPNDAGDYRFSFDATFDGNPSRMNIWVDGMKADGGWIGHGLETPINDDSCSDCRRFWKAGAKQVADKKVFDSQQTQARLKAARSKGNR